MAGNHRSGRPRGSKNKVKLGTTKKSMRLSKKGQKLLREQSINMTEKNNTAEIPASEVSALFKSRLGTVEETVFGSLFARVVDGIERRVTKEIVDERTWVDDYYVGVLKPYKDVRHQFTEEGGLDLETVSEFWKQGITSPWVYAPDPIALNCSDELRNKRIMISTFLLQDVFVWFPALLYGKEGYPHCRTCDNHTPNKVRFKDWTVPRSVICNSRTILLLTVRYECQDCKQTFNCFNKDVLGKYPAYIREAFPFLLTNRKGLHNDVVEDLVAGKMVGESVVAFRKKLLGKHKLWYYTAALKFVSLSRLRFEEGIYDEVPPKFPAWVPGATSNTPIISTHFLNIVYRKYNCDRPVLRDVNCNRLSLVREDYYSRRKQFIDARAVKVDGSFKVAKLVVVRRQYGNVERSVNERVMDGVLTFFNEYEQALLQESLLSNAIQEAAPKVKLMLVDRFLKHGFPPPEVYFTDTCCSDRTFIEGVYRDLGFTCSTANESVLRAENCYIAIPLDSSCHVVEPMCEALAILAVSEIRDMMQEQRALLEDRLVCGLDMQWNLAVKGIPASVAAIQISLLSGASYCFRTKIDREAPTLSKALQLLLEDTTVVKVGTHVGLDVSTLRASHGVEVQNVIDVAQFVVDRQIPDVACRITKSSSLELLVTVLLPGHKVSKPDIHTDWESTNPMSGQLARQACSLSFCNIKLFKAALDAVPLHFRDCPTLADLPSGQLVHMLAMDMSEVAIGEITPGRGDQVQWGPYKFKTMVADRIIVTVKKIFCPSANCQYKQEAGKVVPLSSVFNEAVLWEVKKLRLFRGDMETYVPPFQPDRRAVDVGETCSLSDPSLPTEIRGIDNLQERADVVDNICAFLGMDDHDCADFDAEGWFDANRDQDASAKNGVGVTVKLDIFHAMRRLTKTLRKTHAAFLSFMISFRDAFFMIDKGDLDRLKMWLKEEKKMNEGDIVLELRRNWGLVLSNCKRHVPQPKLLKSRFDDLVAMFANINDSDAGGRFFSSESMKAVKNISRHIENGCLSDPNVPLYYLTDGLTKVGLPKYRCIRGTNSLEGYHYHFRRLLTTTTGPIVANTIVQQWNFRWNHDRAVDNRTLDCSLGDGFYATWLLDEMQILTSEWYKEPLFPKWINTCKFADNGERSELLLFEHRKTDAGPSNMFDNVTAVRTPEERELFQNMVRCYLTHGGSERSNPGGNLLLDAEGMALAWNARVDSMLAEPRIGPARLIFKKSRQYIIKYYKELQANAKIKQIMSHLHESSILTLRRAHRSAGPTNAVSCSKVAEPAIIAESAFSKMLSLPSALPAGKKRKREITGGQQPRRVPLCAVCGHFKKRGGKFHQYHSSKTNSCEVPLELRRSLTEKCRCREGNRVRKKAADAEHFHDCECTDCADCSEPKSFSNPFVVNPLVLPKRISVLHRLLDQEGEEARANSVVVDVEPKATKPSAEGELAVIDVPEKVCVTDIEVPIPILVDMLKEENDEDDAPLVLQGISNDTGVNGWPTEREVYGAITAFSNFSGARHFTGSSTKLTCLKVPRPRRMSLEAWQENCAKELREFCRTHEENPLGRLFTCPAGEEVTYEWQHEYGKIIPQHCDLHPTRSRASTARQSWLRWGFIETEPARRSFWHVLTTSIGHTRRLSLLCNLMMENWGSIHGDGSCFFRALLRGFNVTYDNAALLAFKLRIRTVIEALNAVEVPEIIETATNQHVVVAQTNTLLLEHYNQGWFGKSLVGGIETTDSPSAFKHTYNSHGWGDIIDFGKFLVANSRFLLRRGGRRAACIISIRHSTADRNMDHPFALNSPVMLYCDDDGKLGYSKAPLFIILSYLLHKHDDESDPFDVTQDLCILVYANSHYSAIDQFGNKFV